ncbi:hypothetical protein AUC69_12400 [Methyloceanibacter superfactus]|uniref:Uncharacterized protein n=1 Tax=Methyloceanibacter superfactus TaxID=1774969 RepID=A0A1E3VV57_9HYPH|nr:hypothetical protein AUC69_12400 [Methyloceanibacter superfactus]
MPNSRGTTFKNIYSLPRHGPGNRYVFHHLNAPVTEALRRIQFDGIILHYCFLGHRLPRTVNTFKALYNFVETSTAIKIAICQDDYTCNEVLDTWLDELGVNIVYSPITRDLDVLYPRMSQKPGVEFREGLTGYVDDDMLAESFGLPLAERPIDVGSRVRALGPQLGQHGQRKAVVAERFCRAASAEGFVTDFSTDPGQVLLGNDWLRFLGSCRATIGSRGGASVADADGSIKERCLAYLEVHPDAAYDAVKANCFPDTPDDYRFDAISPRLFEAAATRTAQVLARDDYLGLVAHEDYIPLEDDFSNLPEVFTALRCTDTLARLTDNAYRKLIASKRFSYESFATEILGSIPQPGHVDQEAPALIAEHFQALRGFTDLDETLGTLTTQTVKRAIQRHLRNEPAMPLEAQPSPEISATASLVAAEKFLAYPDRAIQFHMLANWARAREPALLKLDLDEILIGHDASLLYTSRSLEQWGFCECILDEPSSR